MRSFIAAGLVGAASAGNINLALSDCGDSSTHGHVTSLSPTSVPQGAKTRVVGSGSVDEQVTSGSFKAEVKALGVTLQTCSGDFCAAKTCDLPQSTGSITLGGLSCPQAAGDVSINFDVTVSASIPSALAVLEIDLTATSGSGDKLMCAKINTSPAADATLQEPKQYAKGFVRMPRNAAVPAAEITDEMRAAAPTALDWTTKGATSAVKDQGSCGSCWAFSATEGIESGVFMTTGTLPPALSTQQIISCDKTDGGCNGGDLPTAFDYVQSAGGLDTDADYPDTSHTWGLTGRCKSHSNVVQVTGYKYAVPPCEGGTCSGQDEDGLKAALNTYGPLSVCVNANTWNSYYGGVYTASCSGAYSQLDHCVQLVGYDTTASTPYWKVKNSWASDWGENGFIRLPMGKNACGIADEAMYVTATMASTDATV